MLITFLSSECVGQRVVKGLGACVCTSMHDCLYVKLYLWVESSTCICFQRLCMWLFTLCTFCLSFPAVTMNCSLSPPLCFSVCVCSVASLAAFVEWRCIFNVAVGFFTLIITTTHGDEPSHCRVCFSLFVQIMGGLYGTITWKTWNCLDRRVHQETMYRNPQIISFLGTSFFFWICFQRDLRLWNAISTYKLVQREKQKSGGLTSIIALISSYQSCTSCLTIKLQQLSCINTNWQTDNHLTYTWHFSSHN